MKVFTTVRELRPFLSHNSVVSWGNFDGVHLGHQALLRGLVSRARAMRMPAAALTFDPHPSIFLHGGNAPRSITDTADKLALLEPLGLDYVLLLPFDAAFSRQTPEEFVKNVLVDGLKAKSVILGYDALFGKDRQGGLGSLAELGAKYGFITEKTTPALDPLLNTPISSTSIRAAIKNGDMDLAARLLGRVHSVHSLVERGAGRGGSLLGFPTANIDPGPLLLPPYGSYACLVRYDGALHDAAVNFGCNPSVDGVRPSLEAHLLNFKDDLYGREIRIYFLRFLRAEKKFASLAELKEQIALDVENTARIAKAARQAANFKTLYPL